MRTSDHLPGLPVAAVDDFGERAAVGGGDGLQRAIGGIADADQEGDVVISGDAEDLAGLVLVADRGMAGADAQVGRGERDGEGSLPEVVVVEETGAVVVGPGDDQRDGRGSSGDVPRAAPYADSSRS